MLYFLLSYSIVKPTIIYTSRSARLETSPTSECPRIFGLYYKGETHRDELSTL